MPEVRFIGLYDAVTSILTLSLGGIDVGDSRTGDVDISMDDAIAGDVFHITAGHEVRENSSSNHVTPVFKKKLNRPGVHEDTGGQFHEKVEERMYFTQMLSNCGARLVIRGSTSWPFRPCVMTPRKSGSLFPREDVETTPEDLHDLHLQALQQIVHLLTGGTSTTSWAVSHPLWA